MKPREFWIKEIYVEATDGSGIKLLAGLHCFEDLGPNPGMIHVIEKSAYDQLLEQANKLGLFIELLRKYEAIGGVTTELCEMSEGWQEFKKSQGIE